MSVQTHAHEQEFVGREVATPVALALRGAAVLAAGGGLITFAASGATGEVWAWQFGSPLGAALLGACLLGAVPLLVSAAAVPYWEQARIGALPAALVASALTGVTASRIDDLAFEGNVVAAFLALAWLVGVAGTALAVVAALLAQLREPHYPLARVAPIPRWTIPLMALLGSSYVGIGLGLIAEPGFWGDRLPFDVTTIDARVLGAWALGIGATVLGALVEDDLDRVMPGLHGATAIGTLACLAVAWRSTEVDWSGGIPTALFVVLLAALPATGLVGLALRRRA